MEYTSAGDPLWYRASMYVLLMKDHGTTFMYLANSLRFAWFMVHEAISTGLAFQMISTISVHVQSKKHGAMCVVIICISVDCFCVWTTVPSVNAKLYNGVRCSGLCSLISVSCWFMTFIVHSYIVIINVWYAVWL